MPAVVYTAPISTPLGRVITFFQELGVYDVVLPFLLVFTIVYAILEKTRVLGTDKIGDKEWPKKNLNAMAAFVIGFLVVASAQLVAVIAQVSSQMVIILLLVVFYLLLVGSFYGKEELVGEKGLSGWPRNIFLWVVGIAIFAVFLNAFKTEAGFTWLEVVWKFILEFQNSAAVASIILIILIVLFMWYITTPTEPKPQAEPKGDKGGKT